MGHLEEESYRDMAPIWRVSRVYSESTHRYMQVSMPKHRRPDPRESRMNYSRKHPGDPISNRHTTHSEESQKFTVRLIPSQFSRVLMDDALMLQRPLRSDNLLSGWDGPRVYGNSEQSDPPVDECGYASPFHAGRKN